MKKDNFYKILSPYYDDFVNSSILELYLKKIGNVNNLRILDLGCGTGSLIHNYSSKNETFGIDSCLEMIKVAKKKDKKTKYIVQDIKNFNFEDGFHLIICAFDTINHLKDIKEWESLFKSVSKNLLDSGMFMFDFNSIEGFEISNNKTIFKKIGEDFFIMRAEKQNHSCIWKIIIFKRKNNEMFLKEEIFVKEWSYDNSVVLNSVRKYFKKVDFTENKDGSRIYVTAQKNNQNRT